MASRSSIEQRPLPVPVGNHRDRQRPGQREGRIVPAKPARRFRHISRRQHVVNFARISQRLKAVGKPVGHVKLAAVTFRKFDIKMLQICSRTGTNIDNHVVDGASRAS